MILCDRLEAAALIAKVVEVWVRNARPCATRVDLEDGHDPVRIGVRKRLQQHAVYHAENCGGCANGQCQRKHGNSRETARFAQHAEGVVNVLPELLQPNKAPNVARIFLHPHDVAEFAHRGVMRFFRRHAARDVVLRLCLDMLADVFFQILHHALAFFHHSPSCSAGRRIRAIAPAILSHLLVSAASCRRPAAVSL